MNWRFKAGNSKGKVTEEEGVGKIVVGEEGGGEVEDFRKNFKSTLKNLIRKVSKSI